MFQIYNQNTWFIQKHLTSRYDLLYESSCEECDLFISQGAPRGRWEWNSCIFVQFLILNKVSNANLWILIHYIHVMGVIIIIIISVRKVKNFDLILNLRTISNERDKQIWPIMSLKRLMWLLCSLSFRLLRSASFGLQGKSKIYLIFTWWKQDWNKLPSYFNFITSDHWK